MYVIVKLIIVVLKFEKQHANNLVPLKLITNKYTLYVAVISNACNICCHSLNTDNVGAIISLDRSIDTEGDSNVGSIRGSNVFITSTDSTAFRALRRNITFDNRGCGASRTVVS